MCQASDLDQFNVAPQMIEAARFVLLDSGLLSDATVSEEDVVKAMISAALTAHAQQPSA